MTVKPIIPQTFSKAHKLEKQCPLFHSGDSIIAAFSEDNKSTLITADKDLLKACKTVGIITIDPKTLIMT